MTFLQATFILPEFDRRFYVEGGVWAEDPPLTSAGNWRPHLKLHHYEGKWSLKDAVHQNWQ